MICKNCGEYFITTRANKIYCSSSCYRKHRYKKDKEFFKNHCTGIQACLNCDLPDCLNPAPAFCKDEQ